MRHNTRAELQDGVTRWFLDWRRPRTWTIIAVSVFAGLTVPIARISGDDTTSPNSIVVGVLLALVTALLILGLIGAAITLSGVDPGAELIASRLAPASDQRLLLTRWLRRTRWARNVGGYAGLLWWAFGTGFEGGILVFGVAGLTIGSMAAQLHHVRRRPGPRTASLAPRGLDAYVSRTTQTQMLVVAIIAVGVVIAGLALSDTGSASAWGIAALVVIGVAHAIQRRVASRARPALTTGLERADDLARSLAIDRGLARPATYCGLAMIASGVANFEPTLGDWAQLLSVAAWLLALIAWWRNRRLGLDALIAEPPFDAAAPTTSDARHNTDVAG
jgi:hypothetical protein